MARRRNWLAEVGGLPELHDRYVRHLRSKGMAESHAVAVAINAIRKACADPGDQSNWPGRQIINAASRAEACAAAAQFEARRAAWKAKRAAEGRTDVEPEFETRTYDVDVGDLDVRGRTVVGYAAVYGRESHDLGGFRERIAPGAFAEVLAGEPDVRALLNHDPSQILGRTKSGTLRLSDDEQRGLRFELDLPGSPLGENVREAVRRKDLDGASFRFKVADGGDAWEGETRTVTRVGELLDVSIATLNAYPDASIELRSRPQPEKEEPVKPESEDRGAGGLAVEDRTAKPDAEPDIEERVLDALRSVRKGETRTLVTSDATGGGAISPPELASHLFDKMRPRSVALASGIRTIPTDRTEIKWPGVVSDPDADWYAENEEIVASDPVFRTLSADPKKLATRTEFSNEVLDDSEPSAAEVVRNLMLRSMAFKLDRAIYEGNPATNADSIRGLKYTSGIQTLAHGGANGANVTTATLDVISDALAMLEAVDADPGAIVMPARTWGALRKLKDAQGLPLIGSFATPADRKLYGVPVYFTTHLAINETAGTSTDASSVYAYSIESDVGPVLVRRKDAQVELDRSRLFHKDASEMRGKLRVDLLVPSSTPSSASRA